jgi:hypothetical protein
MLSLQTIEVPAYNLVPIRIIVYTYIILISKSINTNKYNKSHSFLKRRKLFVENKI